MSRTYRKTERKQGSPKGYGYGSRHTAAIGHRKAKKPEPYNVPSAFYERVTEEYETSYESYCPVDLRIYVTAGTPHAREELGSIICWLKYPLPPRREPSKWYLVPPNVTKTRTFRKFIRRNPEYDWEEQYKVWEQERLFDHVRRNKTGRRRRYSQKKADRRHERRTNKPDIRDPELIWPYYSYQCWWRKGVFIELEADPDDLDYYDDPDWDSWIHDYDADKYDDIWDDYDPYDYYEEPEPDYDYDYVYDDFWDYH